MGVLHVLDSLWQKLHHVFPLADFDTLDAHIWEEFSPVKVTGML